jgi:hypothetical protein
MERKMKKNEGVLVEEIARKKKMDDQQEHAKNRQTIRNFKKTTVKQNVAMAVQVAEDDSTDDDDDSTANVEIDDDSAAKVEIDDESTDEEDDDLLTQKMILTPQDPEEDDDQEEEEEEPDPEDYQSILGHRKKSGEMLLQVRFFNGKKEWVHIGFALADAPEMVEKYRLAKRLDEEVWDLGGKPGKRVIALLSHRGGGKHQEFQILWDNGFMEWKHSKLVHPLAPKLVDGYDVSS